MLESMCQPQGWRCPCIFELNSSNHNHKAYGGLLSKRNKALALTNATTNNTVLIVTSALFVLNTSRLHCSMLEDFVSVGTRLLSDLSKELAAKGVEALAKVRAGQGVSPERTAALLSSLTLEN